MSADNLDALNEYDLDRFIEGEDLDVIVSSPTPIPTQEDIAALERRVDVLQTLLDDIGK